MSIAKALSRSSDKPAGKRPYFLNPETERVMAITMAVAQELAVEQWIAGKDPASRQFGQLSIPVLVADGTLDQLDPVADDRMLADSVPGAKLILYPGAGHAFLFQDLPSFLSAVKQFLG